MAKNMNIALLFDFYGDMLTEKQQDMIELYYENDLSLSEIAEDIGITRQGVRDSIKRAEIQLLDMEEKLGLAKRFREVQSKVSEIATAANTIFDVNEKYGYSREIRERADQICRLAKQLTEA